MSDHKLPENVRAWVTGRLPNDVRLSLERLAQADDVRRVAVMPDVHLSENVCVGVAVATTDLIYPAAVGSDIGCGMVAIGFDANVELLSCKEVAEQLLASLSEIIPTLKHSQRNTLGKLPAQLEHSPLSDERLERLKHRDGVWQLATLGRGNHFLEFQADQEQRLWLMIHSHLRSHNPVSEVSHDFGIFGGANAVALHAMRTASRGTRSVDATHRVGTRGLAASGFRNGAIRNRWFFPGTERIAFVAEIVVAANVAGLLGLNQLEFVVLDHSFLNVVAANRVNRVSDVRVQAGPAIQILERTIIA